MSKSHDRDFIGLYRAIIADIAAYHPTLTKGLKRDLLRLETLYRTRGEAVFLLDLPAIGSEFLLALDSGKLSLMCLPLAGRINTRTPIPRLFQGVWLQLFDRSGCLRANIDTNDVFFMQTLLFACKKFRRESTDAAKFSAVKAFYDVDLALPPPSTMWDGDGSDVPTHKSGSFSDLRSRDMDIFGGTSRPIDELDHALVVLQDTADRLSVLIGEFIPSDYRFRHGPGAVAEFPRGKGYKYSFPTWGQRLQHVFPYEVFGIANASVLGSGFEMPTTTSLTEGASRLIAVPKTAKGPRLIAAEPLSHQWCQQSIRDFLDSRIRHTYLSRSIDFRRQDLSGDMARAASSSRTYATLDLKEASDRLSCYAVQRFFRKNIPLLEALVATRTRYVTCDFDSKAPKLHKLRKFSSMGSALTFPIQSLFFLGVCLSAGIMAGGRTPKSLSSLCRQVRVYGDDLIVPVAWVPWVVKLLDACFLKVNSSKSFWNGSFRESCGTDAYEGDIVTPARVLEFYSESKPSSLISTIAVANNLFRKGMWHTSVWMTSSVPEKIMRMIPRVGWEPGIFGLVCPSESAFPRRRRWNADLQREEAQVLMAVAKKKEASRYEGAANLLQYFTEDPTSTPLADWESGVFAGTVLLLKRAWVAV